MSKNGKHAIEKHTSLVSAKSDNPQAGLGGRRPAAHTDGSSLTPTRPGESLVTNNHVCNAQLSYLTLRDYHLQRVKFDKDGNQRSDRYLANHKTVINSWTAHQSKLRGLSREDGGSESLVVGEELGVDFTDSLAVYLTELEENDYSPDTLNDRKSILWSVHDSAVDLIKSWGLPESFNEALTVLINKSGKSLEEIAKEANAESRTLSRWATGFQLPERASLPTVERLEDVFRVPRGTLKSRLVHLTLIHREGPFETCATPWRQHQSELDGYDYRLNTFTPTLANEFKDLTSFFTDDAWLNVHGFERNSEWRVDPDGTIPTAKKVRSDIAGLMGFAILSPNPDVPWLNGLGMSPDRLSLALVSDARILLSHADFMRGRAYLNSFNSTTVTFLSTCAGWLRKGTGFLRQQPEYGAKLPKPVTPKRWNSWCESNRQKILKFLKTIKKSKNRPVVNTRDPFAAVRKFIEELDHPISILIEMVGNMKRMMPLLQKGSPVELARHSRDTFFAEFITSYPLRVKNFSRMKVCLQNDDSAPRLEHEDEANFYWRPDSGWWVRYTSREMKNGKAVDIPVAQSVVPLLEEYLFVHRPVLNKAIKDAINSRRAKFGMCPLTPEQERAIESSPYVFRPSTKFICKMDAERLASYTGTERVPEDTLSRRMLRMTQRFIPNCKGFSAHAVRHLVASEYIKNRPDGWEAAAAALNDTEATVRKYYAWVRPCDKIKPWMDYHEDLKRKFGGGSSSPAAAMTV
jgi:transcriptional regulator with XRE-family HTH domain